MDIIPYHPHPELEHELYKFLRNPIESKLDRIVNLLSHKMKSIEYIKNEYLLNNTRSIIYVPSESSNVLEEIYDHELTYDLLREKYRFYGDVEEFIFHDISSYVHAYSNSSAFILKLMSEKLSIPYEKISVHPYSEDVLKEIEENNTLRAHFEYIKPLIKIPSQTYEEAFRDGIIINLIINKILITNYRLWSKNVNLKEVIKEYYLILSQLDNGIIDSYTTSLKIQCHLESREEWEDIEYRIESIKETMQHIRKKDAYLRDYAIFLLRLWNDVWDVYMYYTATNIVDAMIPPEKEEHNQDSINVIVLSSLYRDIEYTIDNILNNLN